MSDMSSERRRLTTGHALSAALHHWTPEAQLEPLSDRATAAVREALIVSDGVPESSMRAVAAETLPESISFFSGNPRVEVVHGELRLFREPGAVLPDPSDRHLPDARSRLLCMLSVPSYMSGQDLCTFVGEYIKDVTHMRVIRDRMPSRYMVLLKFDSQSTADRFFISNMGRPFASFERETCHLIFVQSVVFERSRSSAFLNGRERELPTCPVCLERLDPTASGLSTILCNHTFHTECIRRWSDCTCPVCRFCQQPDDADAVCSDCGRVDGLWICLICGHVACGRYQAAHAKQHAEASGHNYALEIGTQRVWDYAGDGYVHRLISSSNDGKLVAVSNASDAVDNLDEKNDRIAAEYNVLLTSQLEAQRVHFEQRMHDELQARERRIAELEARLDERAHLEATAATAAASSPAAPPPAVELAREPPPIDTEFLQERVRSLEKERKALAQKLSGALQRSARAEQTVEELRSLNATLLNNRRDFAAMLASRDEDIARLRAANTELQDEVRDLRVFLDTQAQIQSSPMRDELQAGHVVVVERDSPASRLHQAASRRR